MVDIVVRLTFKFFLLLCCAVGSALAAQPLPPGTVPVPAPNWVKDPTQATLTRSPNALRINQAAQQVILNWQSFNISGDSAVQFVQPGASAAALNRIFDANPSVIQGRLSANGQIYLINTNGIVFDKGAQINVHSLVASSLQVSDELFLNGILSNSVTGAPSFLGNSGFIRIETGAQLQAESGGRILLFAPQVENRGIVQTPDGQIMLAAGQKVYLAASTDPTLRGVLVEVDSGGTSSNLGSIVAERGNVTLIGLAVNQSGRISASTSVTTLGSVNLLARDTTVVDPNSGLRAATRAGVVTLGPGSTTTVVPDTSTAQTITDQQVFSASRVQVMGSTIDLQGGAAIRAPGGRIELNALANPSSPQLSAPGSPANGSRIYLAPGSVIDASGTRDVEVPMERNFVQVELRATELRDSALQKNGFLQGKTVSVDIRQGTPLADISGAVGADRPDGRGAHCGWRQHRVALGGRRGGARECRSERVRRLDQISRWRRSHDEVARAERESRRHRHGVAGSDLSQHRGQLEYQSTSYPGYSDGRDAGSIDIVARQIALDATLVGSTSFSIYQRDAGHIPLGGRLVIGDASQLPQGAPDFRGPSMTVQTGHTPLPDDFTATSALPDAFKQHLTLSTNELSSGGFSRMKLYGNGDIRVARSADLDLPAGGALSLYAKQIEIDADVSIPAGSIKIGTRNVLGGAAGLATSLTVAPGVQISARGLWVNDSPQAPLSTMARLFDGGSISLASATDLILGNGSLIDVSGGAWLAPDNQLHPGAGGSIDLHSNTAVAFNLRHTGTLQLGSSLRGYAIADGGSLSITAGDVRIADTPGPSADALLLTPDFFRQGGFASYQSTGIDGVVVDGIVQPLMQNLVLNGNYQFKASSGNILPLSTAQVLRSDLRKPTSIALSASSQFFGNLAAAPGSAISTDPGGEIALSAGRQLTVDGELNAPAGRIALTMLGDPLGDEDLSIGFRPGQSIWLGTQARLFSQGAAQIVLDGLLHRTGQVMRAGEIDIVANKGYIVAQPGSVIDASAVSATLDVPELSGNHVVYSPREVSGGAGSIKFRAREGLLVDATLRAAAGSVPGSAGGELSVVLDRQERPSGTVAASYPRGPQEIRIASSGTSVPLVLRPGDPLSVAAFNGKALVTAQRIAAAGFDSVTLKSRDQISHTAISCRSACGALLRSTRCRKPARRRPFGHCCSLLRHRQHGSTLSGVALQHRRHCNAQRSGRHDRCIGARGDARHRQLAAGECRRYPLAWRAVRCSQRYAADRIAQCFRHDDVERVADLPDDAQRLRSRCRECAGRWYLVSGRRREQIPLSAGGELTVNAPSIVVQGTLRAPLGRITLNAQNDLRLQPGSLVSTSADGRLIPFGQTQNTMQWTYVLGDQIVVVTEPPQKTIALDAKDVQIEQGAKVDLSGGGDLYAYEFFAGPGGSADVLSKPGVYAIVPTLGSAYAPRDWQNELGSTLKPGDSVYLLPGLQVCRTGPTRCFPRITRCCLARMPSSW